MDNYKWPIGYQPPYIMGTSDPDPPPRSEGKTEKQIIRLTSPDGSEDIIEVDQELWDKFEALAKELGVSSNDLLLSALDAFLKKEGY